MSTEEEDNEEAKARQEKRAEILKRTEDRLLESAGLKKEETDEREHRSVNE